MKPIETERLLLRPWRREDVEDLYAYAKNPNVGPNAGWKPHESVEESKAILESWIHSDEEDIWAIVPKETGRACGSPSLPRAVPTTAPAATTRTPTIRWAGVRRRWTSWRRSCCPIR